MMSAKQFRVTGLATSRPSWNFRDLQKCSKNNLRGITLEITGISYSSSLPWNVVVRVVSLQSFMSPFNFCNFGCVSLKQIPRLDS